MTTLTTPSVVLICSSKKQTSGSKKISAPRPSTTHMSRQIRSKVFQGTSARSGGPTERSARIRIQIAKERDAQRSTRMLPSMSVIARPRMHTVQKISVRGKIFFAAFNRISGKMLFSKKSEQEEEQKVEEQISRRPEIYVAISTDVKLEELTH